jgi:hypothetical protein
MDKNEKVAINMEDARLREQFPEGYRVLAHAGYLVRPCQMPGVLALHGKVVSDVLVFRKIVEVQTSGSLAPLVPSIVINAVISDTSGVKDVGVDYSVVFSTELNLGERNNLYLEHMQRYKEVDPIVVERLFAQAALMMQAKF